MYKFPSASLENPGLNENLNTMTATKIGKYAISVKSPGFAV